MSMIRITNEKLHDRLREAAKTDGRSDANMLDRILTWYFVGGPYDIKGTEGLVGNLVGVSKARFPIGGGLKGNMQQAERVFGTDKEEPKFPPSAASMLGKS